MFVSRLSRHRNSLVSIVGAFLLLTLVACGNVSPNPASTDGPFPPRTDVFEFLVFSLSVDRQDGHLELWVGPQATLGPVGTFSVQYNIFEHHWKQPGQEQPPDVYVLVVRHRTAAGVEDTAFDIRTEHDSIQLRGDGEFLIVSGPRRTFVDISGTSLTRVDGLKPNVTAPPTDEVVTVVPTVVPTPPPPPPNPPSPPTTTPATTTTTSAPPPTTEAPAVEPTVDPQLIRRGTYTWTSGIAIDLHSTAADWGAKDGEWRDGSSYSYSDRDMEWFYSPDGSSIAIDGAGNRAIVPAGTPWSLAGCQSVWSPNPPSIGGFTEGKRFCAWLGGGIWVMMQINSISPPNGQTPARANVEIAVWRP